VARLRLEEQEIPFDLASGPLLRSRLLRLGAERHVWLLTIHHIVFDGWSRRVLLDEIGAAYRARSSGAGGREAPWPPLALQYADYAAWQDRRLSGERLEAQVAYWRELLGERPMPVRLPSDRPRGSRRRFRGSTVAIDLPDAAVAGLSALAAAEGATLFMALAAVWQAVLHRLSGQDQVLIGTAVAGRHRPEAEPLIGFFVNYALLAASAEDDPSFRRFLGRVREATGGAMEHQEVPFDTLVRALRAGREAGELDAVTFIMDTTPPAPDELAPGLALTALEYRLESSKAEASLLVDASGRRCLLEFDTDLFDRETARCWLDAYAAAVAGAMERPDRPLSELPLFDARAAGGPPRPLAEGWSGRRSGYPRERGLGDLFARVVAERGDDPALISRGDDGDLTYGELDRRANRIARRLLRLGVGRGAPVALALERSPDLIAATLGVVKAGGAYVPLDARYPSERLGFMLEDAGARAVVTESALLARLPRFRGPVLCLDRPADREAVAAEPDDDPAVPTCGDDLAYVMFTSGSTGRPKGVAVPHRGIARLVLESDFVRSGPEETFLQLAPVSFDAATLEIWAPLLTGGRLALAPPGAPTPEALGRSIERAGVSALWLTAGLFHQVVEEGIEALGPVRQLLAGGDVLSPAHCRRVLETHPRTVLINGYGPTENTTFTCCHRMERAGEVPEPVPIGRPVADTTVHVVDPALRPVPETVPGELLTGGDGLAWGYWNRPALTAERFVPDPFSERPGDRLYRTGDLVRWRRDGTLDFLGRTDTQVKVRGFRIEPGEVEVELVAHPAVAEALVTAREVAGDKALVAYLVPEKGMDAPGAAELRSFLAGRVAGFMVPSAFVALERFPLTPNGKVDRRALPEPAREDRASGTEYVAPETEIERVVAALWSGVLGVEPIGAEDDFFELGGHSLLATKVVARLHAEVGVELSMNRIFEASTVRRFAALVEDRLTAGRAGRAGTGTGTGTVGPGGAGRAAARRRRRTVVRRR
jgi:amino acid adenylation domain-containing protein